ncbi:ABC transporter substrate-binding protein [Lutispora thermophila]|uniref:Peptide/nickel transport system substrate-binding protein n=1 Tax=Lutispora thermophila DSM 19022 TaxID=1122184 RepID=A0A1M6DRT8_9FIRM|nr:ABC transporter substrate-binding protein [Lutispora thermophila]SHI75829.1 peptide/nickel transport system substrate-binding protein [Lutispora thermophila DSM 19022]
MKKTICIALLVCIMGAIIAGCSGNGNAQNTEKKLKIAYYAYNTEPYIDFDPSVEYSNGIIVLNNIYETLTRYDINTEKIEPLLAEEWTSNEDGTVWTFKIRKGVKFHDGAELNADAVKKSIERTMGLKMGAAYIWDCVKEIKVIDDYTVEFDLSYPAPLDLIASAGYAAFIISPNAIDKDSTWFNEGNEAGSGPYKVQQVTKGEEVILAKFDDYWRGWNDNQYERVIIKKIPESSSRRQLIEKGEAQITTSLSVTDIKALRENAAVNVIEGPSWKNIIGFYNTEKKPLDNVDFRRALSYAFPYDEVVNDVKEGMAYKSFGLIPKGLWGHDESLMQYEMDLQKAEEYLKKSGVNPEGIKLEVTFTSGSEALRNAAQLYQVNLKKLGIELQIHEMNWDNVWEKSKNTNPEDRQDILFMNWWPDYASPMSWLFSLVHSEETILFNLSYIKDKNLDGIIEKADKLSAIDRAEAEKSVIEVQRDVLDKAYFIHAFDDKSVWAADAHFKGFKPNPAYEGVVFFYDTFYE